MNYSNIKESKNKSLYTWLDTLDGNNHFLKSLFKNMKVQKDILKNLEYVHQALLVYAEHDIRRVRLLKSYFKSINNESSFDLFGKVFITFLFGVLATNLSNGKIVSYFSEVSSHVFKVSKDFETMLNLLMLFLMFLIGIAFLLRELFTDKKRTKIIEEVLEVCIKELEEKANVSSKN